MICTADSLPYALESVLRYPPILFTLATIAILGGVIGVPIVFYVGSKMPHSLRDRFKEVGLWSKFPDVGVWFLGPNHYMAMVYGIDVVLNIPNRWYNKNFDIRKEAPKDYLRLLRIVGLLTLIVSPVYIIGITLMVVGRVLCWLQ